MHAATHCLCFLLSSGDYKPSYNNGNMALTNTKIKTFANKSGFNLKENERSLQ